ncbi:extracellular catalytic domain type 1 short-chain-length polyhydroxyalkanoate depolymerase [Cellvibrio fontiphilus]|uniref:Alpha/beta hydrolase family esterase n=1 Tax=Cellvibrio fontiphilus TaxID=1815559 RepID=A0ABV7FDU4_9GAMM
MNTLSASMNSLRCCIAALCAVFCLWSAPLVVAKSDDGDATLRERIKQRVAERRAERQPEQMDSSTAERIQKPGDYVRSLKQDGLTRRYRIYVPKTYQTSKPAPLVLAFHGGGGDMDYMARDEYYGLLSKAEAEGFVVVFPNGYSKFKSGNFATWNAGSCCADARDKNMNDVEFVREIISRVTRELNINRQMIFATGMSNGGMMSYRLACEMADTFAAIAAVAGTDGTLNCQPSKPISVLHIHAKNDDRVLFTGGAGKKFRDESKVTDFVSVPDTIAKWVKLNHCSSTPQPVFTKPGAYCEQYSRCRAGVAVQLCVTDTGGHSWPGGTKPRGSEPPSTAISANDVMWDFFIATSKK